MFTSISRPTPAPPAEANLLARRMGRMQASAVREILKVAERPDVLSFAGGLPAPELFPVQAIAEAHAEVLFNAGASALQYGVTEGFGPLREWIAGRLAAHGAAFPVESILVTTGSQQGIDLAAKILLDPGDVVVVENPSYLAALQVFNGYEVELEPVGSDDEGLAVDELEDLLARRRVKLVYVVPEFQNPKGTTLSLARRERLIRLAARHGFAILEDDPYGELRFEGERLPPLAALDDAGVVIHLGTFSKTLAPGLRIGWLAAAPHLVAAATVAKQAADLHSSTLAQRAAAALLSTFDYEGHLDTLRATYGARSKAMMAALSRHLPAGTRWTRPEGGLFLWAQLPGGLDAGEILPLALEQKVAFVPGAPFFANHARRDFLRLNFSNRPPDAIELGMERLGRVLGGLGPRVPSCCA
ncbi:MAG TPA: PLP-dependent aminotransferase family protein [Myxococcales bacterium]|nr:PLP-dependent aminotransferase family protein [Myxococcales bacterium]